LALINEDKPKTRFLSAMTKTDCILLYLSQEVFDIMIKDKIKKEKEEKGKFVYHSIPALKDNYTLWSVLHNSFILFEEKTYLKGQWIITEGLKSDKLYLI
jgi:DNA topoisomerase IB